MKQQKELLLIGGQSSEGIGTWAKKIKSHGASLTHVLDRAPIPNLDKFDGIIVWAMGTSHTSRHIAKKEATKKGVPLISVPSSWSKAMPILLRNKIITEENMSVTESKKAIQGMIRKDWDKDRILRGVSYYITTLKHDHNIKVSGYKVAQHIRAIVGLKEKSKIKTVQSVAARLGVNPKKVKQDADDGKFPCYREFNRDLWYSTEDDVKEWVEKTYPAKQKSVGAEEVKISQPSKPMSKLIEKIEVTSEKDEVVSKPILLDEDQTITLTLHYEAIQKLQDEVDELRSSNNAYKTEQDKHNQKVETARQEILNWREKDLGLILDLGAENKKIKKELESMRVTFSSCTNVQAVDPVPRSSDLSGLMEEAIKKGTKFTISIG
jgi:hypothetical protein